MAAGVCSHRIWESESRLGAPGVKGLRGPRNRGAQRGSRPSLPGAETELQRHKRDQRHSAQTSASRASTEKHTTASGTGFSGSPPGALEGLPGLSHDSARPGNWKHVCRWRPLGGAAGKTPLAGRQAPSAAPAAKHSQQSPPCGEEWGQACGPGEGGAGLLFSPSPHPLPSLIELLP